MLLKKKIHITSADLHTPVGLYLSLRDLYPKSLLLESSDYHSANNSSSFVCLEPFSSFQVNKGTVIITEKGESVSSSPATRGNVLKEFQQFLNSFRFENKTTQDGVFGYIGYDAVRYFEEITIESKVQQEAEIPEIDYAFYRFVIRINHFNDEMTLTEYIPEGEESQLDRLLSRLQDSKQRSYPFQTIGEIESNLNDETYRNMVASAKKHCLRGDVFQLVLSRQFSTAFKGDDFNVYRALRTINPSPYLYYFDFGNFKIFGSSPESQVKIEDGKATLNPIAGTYRRTGDDAADRALAEKLAQDEKENAEHAMLVDLARNDLSRSATEVTVETYKEVQFFSHVIHLVSKVSGKLKSKKTALHMVADTFPAGTLSGAPKHRAMQLIDQYENQNRGFYGGAVGFIGLSGNVNLAILIRSFLSKNNRLFFQAGAGIVKSSTEEGELQEVNNKLAALNKAIKTAEKKILTTSKTNLKQAAE